MYQGCGDESILKEKPGKHYCFLSEGQFSYVYDEPNVPLFLSNYADLGNSMWPKADLGKLSRDFWSCSRLREPAALSTAVGMLQA